MNPESAQQGKLVLHVFPSFAAGGAQMRFVTLANRLGREFRHAIVALDGDTSCAGRLDPRLDVGFPEARTERGRIFGNLPRIHGFLRALRPDLLVTSNWGSIEWAMANHLPRIPHIHVEDGFGPEERNRQLPRRVWTRRIALRGSRVVLPSHTLLTIATTIWNLPGKNLDYIPNGVDLRRFAPIPHAPGEVAVIGCVAALRPEKNLSRLLKAARMVAEHRRVRLIIAGDGPERPSLTALAAELGLEVDFRGNVTDPAPLYREFDIFALSSDTEQMPLSILEAMASGLPIASTAVGDIAAMVAPRNLPYLAPCDDGALAQAIMSLLGEEGMAEIGAANRARAEAVYDETLMVSRWKDLWNGAISRSLPEPADRYLPMTAGRAQ
ncbi:MAG TPA: glycosyltransferase family 4 protein [Acetobacteraceae bacterium]|nr:glycosyltransferase family 4 protein [Acetobacteraceae bacterium]